MEKIKKNKVTCADCKYWIGRCDHPSYDWRQKIGKIAASEACYIAEGI